MPDYQLAPSILSANFAKLGEEVDNETLGGATTHCEISGVTDYKAKDDKDALDKIKNIVDKIGDFDKAGFNRSKPQKPKEEAQDIYGILPGSRKPTVPDEPHRQCQQELY